MSDSLPLFDAYAIAALRASIASNPNDTASNVVKFASECAFQAIEARISLGQQLDNLYGIDINSGRPHVPRSDEDLDFQK